MTRRHPNSTRTDTLLPYTTRVRSVRDEGLCRGPVVALDEPGRGAGLGAIVADDVAVTDQPLPQRLRIGPLVLDRAGPRRAAARPIPAKDHPQIGRAHV